MARDRLDVFVEALLESLEKTARSAGKTGHYAGDMERAIASAQESCIMDVKSSVVCAYDALQEDDDKQT